MLYVNGPFGNYENSAMSTPLSTEPNNSPNINASGRCAISLKKVSDDVAVLFANMLNITNYAQIGQTIGFSNVNSSQFLYAENINLQNNGIIQPIKT